MMLEIEVKYPVANLVALEAKLITSGATLVETREDADHYHNAPDRDFAQTDEAFRLRCIGDANYLTYKGPKIDTQTKTRTEIEVEFARGDAAASDILRMLGCLGYRPVAVVHKKRRIYRSQQGRFTVDVSLDELDEVGTFAEVEIIANEGDLADAKAVLQRVADDLGLSHAERRSYLELLLTARADPAAQAAQTTKKG
jgi:adenylate cyclase class 2